MAKKGAVKPTEPSAGAAALKTPDVAPGTAPAPVENPELMGLLQGISSSLQSLTKRMDAIESTDRGPTKTVSESKTKSVASEDYGEVVEAVQKILGQGDPERCEFDVSTVAHQKGVSFLLKMVPPKHLQETENDVRVRVIPYIEAVSGAEIYALKVRDYCIKWANAKGANYFST